jgi:hypothetical protein
MDRNGAPVVGRVALGAAIPLSLLLSCVGQGSTSTTPSGPEAAPHPQGVAIDPVLELPSPQASAEPASGIAVLSEPVDPEPARRVVRAFFDAVVAESLPDLGRVLSLGAHTRGGGRPPRPEPALPHFRRRFDLLDYTVLASEVFYRRSDVEAYVSGDMPPPGSKQLPSVPRGTDVVVRVTVSGQAAQKLFGPELTFVLKQSREAPSSSGSGDTPTSPGPERRNDGGGTYKIAELYEDFRLP